MERDDRMDRLPPRHHDPAKTVEFRRAKQEDILAILSILEFDVPGGSWNGNGATSKPADEDS